MNFDVGPNFMFDDESEPPVRTKFLTSNTPAEFHLNWNHCENGTANPIPQPGVSTLMGPPNHHGLDKSANMIVFVAELFREEGWYVKILPDDRDEEEMTTNGDYSKSNKLQKIENGDKGNGLMTVSLKEKELKYLNGTGLYDVFDGVDVYATNDENENEKKPIATFTVKESWLFVRCQTPEICTKAQRLLQNDFFLAEFPHVHEEIAIPGNKLKQRKLYKLEAITGSQQKTDINTLFSLYFIDPKHEKKLVAQALCSYENVEMNSVGPTLEVIEVAEKWQRHGLGSTLIRVMDEFFGEKFGLLVSQSVKVLFSVCYVTNYNATRWLQYRHKFQDLDGMGEELGKHLKKPRNRK